MPKEVLVICSGPGPESRNYPREENKVMLQTLLGNDYVPVFLQTPEGYQGHYPENLPTGRTFDAILFAGCNVLTWLFKGNYEDGIRRLSSILTNDGIVIFVENNNYIRKFSGLEHYEQHALTTTLDKMQVYTAVFNHANGKKQEIINTWNTYFTQSQIGKYIVYQKRDTAGGRRKTKSRKTRRKRYSRRKLE